ncbi:MAG TPA: acetate/propionate family kinase [Candidatus Limnocylindria bacterium]|nr:acetate/propionate family kinase [Candidatus Limnocylindria bacterium]
MRTLVLNAGSTSLKASLIGEPGDETVARVATDWSGTDADAALGSLLAEIGPQSPDAIGHRVVHGGSRFVAPTLLGSSVVTVLDELSDLAPLHNPPAVGVMRAALSRWPELPQVACFDTAFHASLPPAERIYPLPWEWYADWGIQRFGFHGLSVEWSIARAAALLGRPADELALVVAHLGGGASVSAVLRGRSVRTSMGYTPLEGLMMGSRAGSVDPGLLLEVLADRGVSLPDLTDVLLHRSGMTAIGGSSSARSLEERAASGDERAALALDMFARHAAAGIAAAATALPRLDALVFTGGIGEHSGAARVAITSWLAPLGVPLLAEAPAEEDAVLSPPDAAVTVLRIEAREDLVIARAAASLLG